MDQQSFADCSQVPKVALDFMNTVHCDELALAANLLTAVEASESVEEITQQLKLWAEHTVEHFAREERLMQEYNFPPYPIHKMEHTNALKRFTEIQQQWIEQHNYEALKQYITGEWRSWLQEHISHLDFVTANYLSQFDIEVEL